MNERCGSWLCESFTTHTLRNRAMFGAWLLRIVRREAGRLRRRRLRAAASVSSLGDTLEDRPDPRANGRLAPDALELLSAVQRLPGHERVAVMLRYFQGHSVAEIAEITRRPVGTVTKQLSRAHLRLRRWLGQETQG